MKSSPDVRPPVEGHPDPAKQRSVQAELTRRLFREKGGEVLMADLGTIDNTLEMHRQDADRGARNENPEKFRWRVNPTIAIRLRRERNALSSQVGDLLRECAAEATRINAEMQAAAPAPDKATGPAPETTPTLTITQRSGSAQAETEAAPHAPIHEAA